MNIIALLCLCAGISGAENIETLKASAERKFALPKIAHNIGAKTPQALPKPDRKDKDKDFIGCRPSFGECANSCPSHDFRVQAKKDPVLCPEPREPLACYCRSK